VKKKTISPEQPAVLWLPAASRPVASPNRLWFLLRSPFELPSVRPSSRSHPSPDESTEQQRLSLQPGRYGSRPGRLRLGRAPATAAECAVSAVGCFHLGSALVLDPYRRHPPVRGGRWQQPGEAAAAEMQNGDVERLEGAAGEARGGAGRRDVAGGAAGHRHRRRGGAKPPRTARVAGSPAAWGWRAPQGRRL